MARRMISKSAFEISTKLRRITMPQLLLPRVNSSASSSERIEADRARLR
jgi:hypothetical protein